MPVYFFFSGEHAEYHTPKDKPETINFAGVAKVTDLVDQLATKIAADEGSPRVRGGDGQLDGRRPAEPARSSA